MSSIGVPSREGEPLRCRSLPSSRVRPSLLTALHTALSWAHGCARPDRGRAAGDARLAGTTRAVMLSADRDIVPQDIAELTRRYDARILDWESGSIARVCKLNRVPCLIARGVSDVVDASEGEAYGGKMAVFVAGTEAVMPKLLASLPAWVSAFRRHRRSQVPTGPATSQPAS